MRLAKSLVPTLREDPADAEALSHKLMLRAGLVRHCEAKGVPPHGMDKFTMQR